MGNIPDTVISSSNRGPADPSNFNKLFKRLLDTANIENANFDILRYTFAVCCLEKGFNITELCGILGCGETSKTVRKLKQIMKRQTKKTT